MGGLCSGAASMAIGEYISMSVEGEAMRAQVALERTHLAKYPIDEEKYLAGLLSSKGISEKTIKMIVHDLRNATAEEQLSWHATFALGIDLEEQNAPCKSAFCSFLGFTLGATIPILPWFFLRHDRAKAFSGSIIVSLSITLLFGYVFAFMLGLDTY